MDDLNNTQQEEALQEETAASSNQANVLLEIEQLIKSHISSIEKLSKELRENRQMFDDGFNNDATFKEHAEVAKKAAKVKTATKQEIIKRPGVAQIAEKIKTISAELKEKKLSLSEYLLEYQRMAGVNEIEDDSGQVHEIIHEAKLIKRPSKQAA